jgi:hypothetical protein
MSLVPSTQAVNQGEDRINETRDYIANYAKRTGTLIELWVLCSDGATNVGSVTFDTVLNGSRVPMTVSLPAGFGSKLIRSATQATGSQTVELDIPATGTSGLGGPTDHHKALSLGTVPGAPGAPVASNVTDNDVTLSWSAAAASPAVTQYGLYVSESSSFSSYVYQAWVGNVLTKTLSNLLKPGKKYYARVRAQNSVGTGGYSSTSNFTTINPGVYVSDGVNWKAAEVFHSSSSAWVKAEVFVSNGTAWVAPL